MKSLFAIPAALAFLLAAAGAAAIDGIATVEIENGVHVVTVTGCFYEGVPEGIAGIVLECQVIGGCEDAFFQPETPAPLELAVINGDCSGYIVTIGIVPPHPEAAYLYRPYWVDEAGDRFPTDHFCDSDPRTYALAVTDQTPLVRGTLVFAGVSGSTLLYRVDTCADGCWLEFAVSDLTQAQIEELSGLALSALAGRAVDVFGDRTHCAMPGGPYYDLTRIALAPDGACGPVPAVPLTWDGLKALYR